MSDSFTHDWYQEFLAECRRHGNPIPLREVETAACPQIILRHDVDFTLEAAWELSRVEERAGVRSTYFVLLTSHYYNPASSRGRWILRDLARRGFEVGLHFDPVVYEDSGIDDLAEQFDAERRFLRALAGDEVRSVTIHCPTSHGLYPMFPGVVNAYDPRWFGPDRYLSDSLRRWRRNPIDFVRSAAALGRVQVLTHPLHYSADGGGYVAAMSRLSESWTAEAHAYLYEKNQTYREECLRDNGQGRGVSL
jgi:hypothetical protein